MKRFSYLLLAILFLLPTVGVKAQTSASMGLNGAVESYEIDGGDYIGEYATFNPANKKLKSFQVYCVHAGSGWFEAFGKWLSFKVKGNRPTTIVNNELVGGGVYDNFETITYTFTYKYSGSKVVSVTEKEVVNCSMSGGFNLKTNRRNPPHRWKEVPRNFTTTYKYTKNDQFGNWIERRATCKGNSWTETREIVYNKEWLNKQTVIAEKKKIQSFEESDNLYGLNNYLQADLQPESKQYGQTAWNKLVLSPTITQKADSAHKYYDNALITSETQQKLSEAWSAYTFHQLKGNNDLDGLYNLSKDSIVARTVADSAQAYWNEQKWASVSGSNATYQQIADIANHPFAYKDKANEAWNRVQQLYFTNEVMRHTDFREVDADLAKALGGRKVFENAELRYRVEARRDSLRNAEIADYLAQSKQAQSEKDLEKAVSTAQHVLSIDPNNAAAISLSADNGYANLKKLKKQKSITDADYAQYVKQNPLGKYTSEIQDERAIVLAKQAHEARYLSFFDNQILRLPMSEKCVDKVNAYKKRTFNRINRGNFLHFGGEALIGYAMGPDLFEYGGGATIRFGWTLSPINVATGFNYVRHKTGTTTDKNFDALHPIYRGGIGYATMEVPLQLRWNLVHQYDFCLYLGAGAQFNINRKGRLEFHDELPETEEKYIPDNAILKKTNFVGYYSLGFDITEVVGLEFYVKHDLTSRFDKDYVRATYGVGSPVQLLPKAEKVQMDKNFSFGLKFKIYFDSFGKDPSKAAAKKMGKAVGKGLLNLQL